MAAGFALAKANVEAPDGSLYPGVAVMVRNNRLTISQRGTVSPLIDDETVERSERLGRKQWAVTTSAGVFTITKEKCNCGGG